MCCGKRRGGPKDIGWVFRITTHPLLQHVKIYSTLGIDFHLVGDFNYHVGPSD
jgi:hypothetical protein